MIPTSINPCAKDDTATFQSKSNHSGPRTDRKTSQIEASRFDTMTDKSAVPKPVVRVGVGVLVKDPKDPTRVFCGIRKGSHGAGKLALPGGHLEMFESWEDCASREVLEECNLELETPMFGHVTNDPMPDEGKHYVTIFMLATCKATDPVQTLVNMEPHKCAGWDSYSWKDLESWQAKGDLFGPLDLLVQQKPKAIVDFLKLD